MYPKCFTYLIDSFYHFFSKITAGFGSSMSVAIGMSLTSIVEIIYWTFIKPFGFARSTCKTCLKKYKTHYPSRLHKRFSNMITKSLIALYLAYAGYRLYLVIDRIYINPPQPEEYRNQIRQKLEPFFHFLKFW